MFWQCSLLIGNASSLECNQSGCGVVHWGGGGMTQRLILALHFGHDTIFILKPHRTEVARAKERNQMLERWTFHEQFENSYRLAVLIVCLRLMTLNPIEHLRSKM